MKDERNNLNNLSKSINKLIYFFLVIIVYFSATILGYEILKLRDFLKEKFYDRSITSFHFCQWQFLNTTTAIEDEILHFNYRDILQTDSYRNELRELFRSNLAYGSAYDEFCKKIHYCGVYYVFSFLVF